MIEWQSFLARWSRELMATELANRLDPPPDLPDWLGFPAASGEDIAELENKLGLLLPPSYAKFLAVSNGWRRTTPFIGRMRPAEEVDWFRVENEQWADVYSEPCLDPPDEEYYDYNEDGANALRSQYMNSLVQISDVDDGVCLLNPEVVTPDGEWEAWFFANWVPGARRFPTFAHLMLSQYRTFAQLEGVKLASDVLPKLSIPAADVPRVQAKRLPTKRRSTTSFESLIGQMRSSDAKERAKAVRIFVGKLKGRSRASQRPDLVQHLVDLFRNSSDFSVRSACVSALTEFAEDGQPPSVLLDALSDSNPGVVLTGIFALTYFPDRRAVEPLCRFIESRVNALFNESAMSQLGQLGDERAVPTLLNVLLDTDNEFEQSFGSAAMALAGCGAAGFDALVTAHRHSDPRIRHAAVVGLDVSRDARATALLDQCESDPDPRVRKRAKVRVGNRLFRRTLP
jgi:hypothetical protein